MMKRLVLSYYGVKQVNLYYKIDFIYLSDRSTNPVLPPFFLEVLLRARVAGSTLFDQRLTTCGESQRSAA